MFDFINISFIDVLDVLMVGLLIYWLIRVVRGTSAVNIFIGVLLLYVVWIASRALGMKLLSFILGQVLGVGVVALLVIFQPEIRRFLLRISSSTTAAQQGVFKKLFRQSRAGGMAPGELEELTAACRKMSETKTGALIVLRHGSALGDILDTGDEIDARINRRLIENIFFKNSPLHDGAMVITANRILAARCTLPITQRQDIPAHYGMRHRAAIGMSEVSDASVIVVSEETGDISFVSDGQIQTMGSITELRLAIENSFK
ncbi:MAG: diadenylate cyclase CdaA [Bacteroidales bacterium]|nr:diadenylate cyclase CdaA [Bacteroidales bacterium]MBQ2149211.1 diadenylate cyclase CdaA [Bacteroidales bacterium]MBQ5435169.1 diadenylate cyclase CdaA [Bacteroidales bacterium]